MGWPSPRFLRAQWVASLGKGFNKQVSHINKMVAENSEIPLGGRNVCCLFLSPLCAGMWVWALKTHCICIRNWKLAAWHTKYVEIEPGRLFCFSSLLIMIFLCCSLGLISLAACTLLSTVSEERTHSWWTAQGPGIQSRFLSSVPMPPPPCSVEF